MSTMTAVAPPLGLLGPAPQEPPHSLLALLRKLGDGFLVEGDRVAPAGVWMSPCVLPLPHDPCSEGTLRDKDEGDDAGASETFYPFTAYSPMICSSYPAGNDWEGFENRLRQAFRARESYAVEKELAAGAVITGTPNPAFADSAMTALAGGAAVSPGVALSYLEDAIAASGARGIIHATPAVVAAWQAMPFDDVEAGVLMTANGNYVVSGSGYTDVTPTGQSAPGAGEDWAFATGLVYVRRSDEQRFTLTESLDRSDNTLIVRVERDYLAAFDPCVQAGVLVDWTQ